MKNDVDRRNLTKIRVSSHKLMIEKGRHLKIPSNERFCPFCPNIIENEEHLLMSCQKYNDLRIDVLNNIAINFCHLDAKNIFIYLMSSEGIIIEKVAKFYTEALKLRDISGSVAT